MHKIKIICKEFVSASGNIDVDSRLFHKDKTPIYGKNLIGKNYHLGQISSSFGWAKHDILNHFTKQLDELFPEGYGFEFEFISISERRTKVALDIDGVIANFCEAVIEKAGKLGMAADFPKSWREIEHWGISPCFNEVWDLIKEDYRFWMSIDPLPFCQPLDFEVDCYVTARPIDSDVSANWLFLHGFPAATVFTVSDVLDKFIHLQIRGVDLFVDDNYLTVKHLREKGINAVLFDAPYHRFIQTADVPRINNLSEVRRLIEKAKLGEKI